MFILALVVAKGQSNIDFRSRYILKYVSCFCVSTLNKFYGKLTKVLHRWKSHHFKYLTMKFEMSLPQKKVQQWKLQYDKIWQVVWTFLCQMKKFGYLIELVFKFW